MEASDLAASLGLNLEDVEEIDGEILKATQAWERLLPQVERSNFNALLMQELGAGGSDDLAVELAKLPKGDLQAYVRAYIAWLFQEDADAGEYGDGEADDNAVDGDDRAPEQAGGWTKVKWAVQPVAKPVDGVTWQCLTCRIINDWNAVKCQGCDARAPHSDATASATSEVGGTVFSGFSRSAAAGAGSITSGGFTFASSTSPAPVGSISAAGFSFSPAPELK